MTNEERLRDAFGGGYFTLEQAMEVLGHTNIRSTKRVLREIGSMPITKYRLGVQNCTGEDRGVQNCTGEDRGVQNCTGEDITPEPEKELEWWEEPIPGMTIDKEDPTEWDF